MNYEDRLKGILKERDRFTLRLVQRRLIANGKERGISLEYLSRVMNRKAVNEDVLYACEQCIKMDKDFDKPLPLALMNSPALINHVFSQFQTVVA